MFQRNQLSIVGFALILAGCSVPGMKQQVHFTDRNGVDILTDLENGTGYTIVPTLSKERICRTSAPDVIASMSDSAAVSALGESAGNNESFSSVTLGGRSPEVLIAREIMYRICELSLNTQLSDEELLTLYKNTIVSITDMAKTVGVEQGSAGQGYTGEASQTLAPATSATQSGENEDEADDSSEDSD